MSRARPAVVALAAAAQAACTPATVSTIGPRIPAKDPGCEIEILDPGEIPDRPYRDVGVVSLESCQDYREPPCEGWLVERACSLGGDVAYVSGDPERIRRAGPVTFRVLVAAWVSGLRPDPESLRVRRIEACDPPCPDGLVCRDGECRLPDVPDCDEVETAPESDDAGPQRCVE